eukprot:458237-Pelagomonas_calceolata.AAC.1
MPMHHDYFRRNVNTSPVEEAFLLPWLRKPPAKPAESCQLGDLDAGKLAAQRSVCSQAGVPEKEVAVVEVPDAAMVVEVVDAVAGAVGVVEAAAAGLLWGLGNVPGLAVARSQVPMASLLLVCEDAVHFQAAMVYLLLVREPVRGAAKQLSAPGGQEQAAEQPLLQHLAGSGTRPMPRPALLSLQLQEDDLFVLGGHLGAAFTGSCSKSAATAHS